MSVATTTSDVTAVLGTILDISQQSVSGEMPNREKMTKLRSETATLKALVEAKAREEAKARAKYINYINSWDYIQIISRHRCYSTLPYECEFIEGIFSGAYDE